MIITLDKPDIDPLGTPTYKRIKQLLKSTPISWDMSTNLNYADISIGAVNITKGLVFHCRSGLGIAALEYVLGFMNYWHGMIYNDGEPKMAANIRFKSPSNTLCK